ncbi:MAG: aminotransferase class IV [Solirubrobacterales bacterium]
MAVVELASVDGEIGPTREATIALPDDGLFRGDGVFEVVRLYAGRPFALLDHLDRLERSAAAIELGVERRRLEDELAALLERHGDGDAQLRIVLTRAGRRVLAIEELLPHAETIRLASVTYSPTGILDGVKSLSYGANMHATRIAQGRGADEALLVRPDGIVLEAPTSSIFWVGGGDELRTPALGTGILDSITRRAVLGELEVAEGDYSLDDLRAASEAFIASTTREVQPVGALDDVELAAPGPRTRDAQEAFARVLAAGLGDGA